MDLYEIGSIMLPLLHSILWPKCIKIHYVGIVHMQKATNSFNVIAALKIATLFGKFLDWFVVCLWYNTIVSTLLMTEHRFKWW